MERANNFVETSGGGNLQEIIITLLESPEKMFFVPKCDQLLLESIESATRDYISSSSSASRRALLLMDQRKFPEPLSRCLAEYGDRWCRSVLITTQGTNLAHVYHMDYGSYDILSLNKIVPIPEEEEEFGEGTTAADSVIRSTPALAKPFRLSGDHSKMDTDRMKHLIRCAGFSVWIKIDDQDEDNGQFIVTIYYRSGNGLSNLNETILISDSDSGGGGDAPATATTDTVEEPVVWTTRQEPKMHEPRGDSAKLVSTVLLSYGEPSSLDSFYTGRLQQEQQLTRSSTSSSTTTYYSAQSSAPAPAASGSTEDEVKEVVISEPPNSQSIELEEGGGDASNYFNLACALVDPNMDQAAAAAASFPASGGGTISHMDFGGQAFGGFVEKNTKAGNSSSAFGKGDFGGKFEFAANARPESETKWTTKPNPNKARDYSCDMDALFEGFPDCSDDEDDYTAWSGGGNRRRRTCHPISCNSGDDWKTADLRRQWSDRLNVKYPIAQPPPFSQRLCQITSVYSPSLFYVQTKGQHENLVNLELAMMEDGSLSMGDDQDPIPPCLIEPGIVCAVLSSTGSNGRPTWKRGRVTSVGRQGSEEESDGRMMAEVKLVDYGERRRFAFQQLKPLKEHFIKHYPPAVVKACLGVHNEFRVQPEWSPMRVALFTSMVQGKVLSVKFLTNDPISEVLLTDYSHNCRLCYGSSNKGQLCSINDIFLRAMSREGAE